MMAEISNNDDLNKLPDQTDVHDVCKVRSEVAKMEVFTMKIDKLKVFKTVAIYSIFLLMGLSGALLGTTFVHLQKLFNITPQTLSLVIIISSGGMIFGTIACAILYDRLKPEIIFAAFSILGVAATFILGYSQNIYVYTSLLFFREISFGFHSSAGQSYCVGVWLEHKLKKPLLQGLHAIWSLGGIFGPVIFKPFLCELNPDITEHMSKNNSVGNIVEIINATHGDGCSNPEESIETTRHGYLTLAIISLVGSLPFVILCIERFMQYYKRKKLHNLVENKIYDTKTTQEATPQTSSSEDKIVSKCNINSMFKFIYMVFIWLFGMLTVYSEMIPAMFLMSFALKYLKWSVMNSSLLLSVFFGAHFAGRLVGIVSSVWITPLKVLCFNLLVTFIANLIMLFVNEWPNIAWISAVIGGFGVSTTFPTNVLWISETTLLTGKVSAMLFLGACSCIVSAPFIITTITSSLGQMWYVYILICAALVHICVFVLEACFVRKWSKYL